MRNNPLLRSYSLIRNMYWPKIVIFVQRELVKLLSHPKKCYFYSSLYIFWLTMTSQIDWPNIWKQTFWELTKSMKTTSNQPIHHPNTQHHQPTIPSTTNTLQQTHLPPTTNTHATSIVQSIPKHKPKSSCWTPIRPVKNPASVQIHFLLLVYNHWKTLTV